MNQKNADYDQLFECTAEGISVRGHWWTTIQEADSGEITKCSRCHIVQLTPAMTGEDVFPHGPYTIPGAHARRAEGGTIVSEPHVLTTISDAYDAFRTTPGNRDGSYSSERHFVQTLTAGGMDPDEAEQLYRRNRQSIVEFHWTNSPDVARLQLL